MPAPAVPAPASPPPARRLLLALVPTLLLVTLPTAGQGARFKLPRVKPKLRTGPLTRPGVRGPMARLRKVRAQRVRRFRGTSLGPAPGREIRVAGQQVRIPDEVRILGRKVPLAPKVAPIPGQEVLERAAGSRLRPGEKIVGVSDAWFRTDAGELVRVEPDRFNRHLLELVRAQGKQASGVSRATFVTSRGRRLTVGQVSRRDQALTMAKSLAVVTPALIGVGYTIKLSGDTKNAIESVAEPIKKKILPPEEAPTTPESSSAKVTVKGGGSVIEVSTGTPSGDPSPRAASEDRGGRPRAESPSYEGFEKANIQVVIGEPDEEDEGGPGKNPGSGTLPQ